MTLEHAASRALMAAQESTRLIDTQTQLHAPGNTDPASARRRRARTNYLALVRGRHSVARMYQLQFIVLLSVATLCFGLVRFASHRIEGDGEPPIEIQQRKVIFECNSDGKAKMCIQCNRWRPVKARHCNDCGVCIPGFDHHCPFMDACVARESIEPFFCFLVAAVLLIGISIIPLVPIIYEALMRVHETTWNSVELRERWWDRKLSWIGGPVTRYAYGLFIAYRVYSSSGHPPLLRVRGHRDPTYDPCPLLSSPHFGPLLVVVTAVFVMLVGVAMITTIILNARQGLSAVQVERIRRHRARSSSKSNTYDPRIYIYLPPAPRNQTSSLSVLMEGEQDRPEEGVIVAVDPEEPLFDLGASKNLEALLGRKWWEWGMPWRRSRIVEGDEVFNPKVITQLREKARKQP
ncbi:BZ3500_MvSof-1268-A1-R1_Chr1-3g01892 [Microbotryum saponariae]|uniref:Palmitoyltransferase n=1 Tax=Microbotryum saponariae TaxID=289078 RepID=A0A2X0MQX0_9BASI|nr:BZ3500_MvSof-1268-A1-R1_Chr1-3g01892 [Microbotryum saponariae]SCZ94844.1 BZ3501_MvSof-1269-A2-R1_Chr1-3g01494 [Microbotryum saponariae]